jgi:hypothetical protein
MIKRIRDEDEQRVHAQREAFRVDPSSDASENVWFWESIRFTVRLVTHRGVSESERALRDQAEQEAVYRLFKRLLRPAGGKTAPFEYESREMLDSYIRRTAHGALIDVLKAQKKVLDLPDPPLGEAPAVAISTDAFNVEDDARSDALSHEMARKARNSFVMAADDKLEHARLAKRIHDLIVSSLPPAEEEAVLNSFSVDLLEAMGLDADEIERRTTDRDVLSVAERAALSRGRARLRRLLREQLGFDAEEIAGK